MKLFQMYRISSNSSGSTHQATSHQKSISTTASNSKRVFLNREDHCVYASHDGNPASYSDKSIYTTRLRNCSHSSQYQMWVCEEPINHAFLKYSLLMSIKLITCRPSMKQVFSNWEQSRGRFPWHSNVLTTEKVIRGVSHVWR
jgi:hypothetical protein